MSDAARASTRLDRATAFLEWQHDYYAAYHHHKEGMAYAGFTVYAGIAGAALFTPGWPPHWGPQSVALAVLAATGLWALVLSYLKFQLLRRRWAAVRRAGCEHLLAHWLTETPADQDLAIVAEPVARPIPRLIQVVDWVFPLRTALRAVDTDQSVYPIALTREWINREVTGTKAIAHERFLVVAGWILYVAIVIKAFHPA